MQQCFGQDDWQWAELHVSGQVLWTLIKGPGTTEWQQCDGQKEPQFNLQFCGHEKCRVASTESWQQCPGQEGPQLSLHSVGHSKGTTVSLQHCEGQERSQLVEHAEGQADTVGTIAIRNKVEDSRQLRKPSFLLLPDPKQDSLDRLLALRDHVTPNPLQQQHKILSRPFWSVTRVTRSSYGFRETDISRCQNGPLV